MPHDQDLTIVFAELRERGVEPADQLAADGLGRGRRPLIAQRACQID